MTKYWREELLDADKNIGSVVLKTVRLKGTKSNQLIMLALSIFCIILISSLVLLTTDYASAQSYSFTALRDIAPLILAYGVGILGFLIAGFAILASSNHGELFEILAKTTYPDESVSILQFIFYNFLSSIFLHLSLISYIFLIVFFTKINPIASSLVDDPRLGLIVNLITLASFILFQIFSLLNVKSFAWNLYSGLLMSIATESKIREKQRSKAKSST